MAKILEVETHLGDTILGRLTYPVVGEPGSTTFLGKLIVTKDRAVKQVNRLELSNLSLCFKVKFVADYFLKTMLSLFLDFNYRFYVSFLKMSKSVLLI